MQPLSFSQESLWILHQLERDNPAYNEVVLLRLRGNLDVGALEKALNELIRRHEILRTAYPMSEAGEPYQQVLPFQPLALPIQDFSSSIETEREQTALRYVRAESYQTFDLLHGPVLRFGLARLSVVDHLLYVSIHHIANDAWTQKLLIQELAACYEAFVHGSLPNLTLSTQYADYAQWQRQWLQSESYQKHRGYWKERFSGDLPALHLPLDHPRPPHPQHRGRRYIFNISPEVVGLIHQICQRERLSLFTFMATVFNILLMRYTGQSEIIIGCPFANRRMPGSSAQLDNTIGMFVNTLPLRVELNGNPTAREALLRVRNIVADAINFQAFPFERLVKELQPERAADRNPIFQVLINMRNVPDRPYEVPGLEIREIFDTEPGVNFDLSLELKEMNGSLVCALRYDVDLFEASTIERMAMHLQNIVNQMLLDGNAAVSTFELLSDKERTQLLLGFNSPASDYSSTCLHQIIQSQAEASPFAVAVSCNGEQITYEELTRRADDLAHIICSHLAGSKSIIGLYLPRSIDLIIAQLAVLKAGSAYLPLDLTYPRERIQFMIADANPVLTLTMASLISDLPADIPALCLDARIAASAVPGNLPTAHPDDAAYVIYTSGSTGQPKGSIALHRGAANYIQDMIRVRELKPGEHVLQFTPFSFDASVRDTLGVLAFGGTILLMDDEQMRDPAALLGAIKNGHANVILSIVPTMLRTLSEAAIEAGPFQNALRLIMVSGEVLTVSDIKKARQAFGPDLQIINQYGPTECSMISTTFMVPPVIPAEWVTIPIGKPIANTRIYILDPNSQPVPVGVAGEIWIGGIGVGGGYLNRHDLTAEKFIADPFLEMAHGHMYRTGDLGKYLPDGTILFLGRMDSQVKIRGYRVELGEIEEVLKQHPAVGETAVILQGADTTNASLIAYVMPASESEIPGDLREHVASYLPVYMIPAAFIRLDVFPMTTNGKIDRKALSLLPVATPVTGYVAPSNEIENQMVKIWQEVMGLEKIGVRDNFFDLGGDSIGVVRVLSRIKTVMGTAISIRKFFEASTVAGLADLIKKENFQ